MKTLQLLLTVQQDHPRARLRTLEVILYLAAVAESDAAHEAKVIRDRVCVSRERALSRFDLSAVFFSCEEEMCALCVVKD